MLASFLRDLTGRNLQTIEPWHRAKLENEFFGLADLISKDSHEYRDAAYGAAIAWRGFREHFQTTEEFRSANFSKKSKMMSRLSKTIQYAIETKNNLFYGANMIENYLIIWMGMEFERELIGRMKPIVESLVADGERQLIADGR
jgi:hypothetical protein